MPIHKRDRNFQKIVSELDIKSVPTQYIHQLTLICENGDRINFKGPDIDQLGEPDVVAALIRLVEENDDLISRVIDIEMVIDYTKLEADVKQQTEKILSNDNS